MHPESQPPPAGGWERLAALRDEAQATRAGPAPPQTSEEAQGEVPGPARREGLAEQQRGEGEVRRYPSVRGVKEGGQRSCPKDGRRADDGTKERLRHAHVRSGQAPEVGEISQAPVQKSEQRSVARRTAEHYHRRIQLSAERQPGRATPLRDEGRRHLGARARRQRGRGVPSAVVAAGGIRGGRRAQLLELRPAADQVVEVRAPGGPSSPPRRRRGRKSGVAGRRARRGRSLLAPRRLRES